MKDVFAAGHEPIQSAKNKIHPLVKSTIEMLNNRDFFDAPIRNEDDPLVKQLGDLTGYAVTRFTPYSVGRLARGEAEGEAERKEGEPPGQQEFDNRSVRTGHNTSAYLRIGVLSYLFFSMQRYAQSEPAREQQD
jgi:hypothetical protein